MFDRLNRPVSRERKTQAVKRVLVRPHDGRMPNCGEAAIV
jgi:hypothetical protein